MQDYEPSAACLCPEVCQLRDSARDDRGLCLFTVCEVINGSLGLPANCQGQRSPERWSISKEKKIYTHPLGGLILSPQTFMHAWVHGRCCTSLQIPRPWHGYIHADEELEALVRRCGELTGTGRSLALNSKPTNVRPKHGLYQESWTSPLWHHPQVFWKVCSLGGWLDDTTFIWWSRKHNQQGAVLSQLLCCCHSKLQSPPSCFEFGFCPSQGRRVKAANQAIA